jgi:hypothetical protein
MGTALVLLNSGIDELGNPRLRDAGGVSAAAWKHLRPTDPTPVLQTAPARRHWRGGPQPGGDLP